jgi:hypothetical protein
LSLTNQQSIPLLKYEGHQTPAVEEEEKRHDLFDVAKLEKEDSESNSSNDDEPEHN